MFDIDASRELFLKLYPDRELCREIEGFVSSNKAVRLYYALCRRGLWELFFKKDNFTKLSLVFLYLPTVKENYGKKGISDKVFFDTLDDLRIWIDDCFERTGKKGLYEIHWLVLHLRMQIFKIGRLQYQLGRYRFKAYKGLSKGDRVLNIHIPRGEKLDYGECVKSIDEAQSFFKEFFPDYGSLFTCRSWLLFPDNRKFMKPDCNILRFSELFEIVGENYLPEPAYLWIFGIKLTNAQLIANMKAKGCYGYTENLPADTSLQRSAIKYINGGGKLGEGEGVIII